MSAIERFIFEHGDVRHSKSYKEDTFRLTCFLNGRFKKKEYLEFKKLLSYPNKHVEIYWFEGHAIFKHGVIKGQLEMNHPNMSHLRVLGINVFQACA